MKDWTVKELEKYDKEICKIAKEKYDLDWFPIEYEILDYHEMLGAMAYSGLPTHYRHWSFGKAFERTSTRYNLGMEGLPYEMIINSNPSIAYLMLENPMSIHLLTMAHCVGHSDFFKNNRMFKETDPSNVISRFKSASKRVRDYIEDPSIGIDKVEAILDACHSIQYQVPRTPGIAKRPDNEEGDESNKNLIGDLFRFENLKDYNLLGFIKNNSRNLEDWQRDLIGMVERRSLYFIPQAKTKIMNEGWAVTIHEKIMNDLNLPDKYQIAFLKSHNQVVRPILGRVNPYHLGYSIFKKIEKEHGFEECKLVRETHDDEAFIRKYLDEDLCRELNLFSYSYNRPGKKYSINDISDKEGWKSVRTALISNVGLNSVPVVRVDKFNKKMNILYLKHEHDGRDLELSYANKVYDHIKFLWDDDIIFTSILEGELWEF
ncbi:MAG: SpoVR family protein [Gammaproteobacteria bacterium]|nr:SpoVR family protein [Gammaproteobacteria bacterium]